MRLRLLLLLLLAAAAAVVRLVGRVPPGLGPSCSIDLQGARRRGGGARARRVEMAL